MTAELVERRPVAPLPASAPVEYQVPDGERFAGWWIRIRGDFPAELLIAMERYESSPGGYADLFAAIESITLDHNMPSADGTLAPTLREVVDFQGVVAVWRGAMEQLVDRPNPPNG